MGLVLHQVDAFTKEPFRGNPAAVLVLREPLEDSFMQAVAAEMNLSETAFVIPAESSFGLRWFTPTAEVDLCGHATLASAHVLWELDMVRRDESIAFDTLSGRLEASWKEGRIEMDFPAEPARAVPASDLVREAVRRDVEEVGLNRLDYIVRLESEDAVRTLEPNLDAVARLGSRGMIVTAASSDPAYDFVSRYFAPQFGVPEDPVTGSAHCCLGPFWRQKLGKDVLVGLQTSARSGVVYVTVRGDRVTLGGNAVTTARIDLLGHTDQGSPEVLSPTNPE